MHARAEQCVEGRAPLRGARPHRDTCATHVQPASDLPLATHLHVNPLIQAEPDEIERLFDCGIILCHCVLLLPSRGI